MRNIRDIIQELREHPDTLAVVVWTEKDRPDSDEAPEEESKFDHANWEHVEDRMIEIGYSVIYD